MPTITTFLGWCTVINIALLTYSTVMLVLFKATVIRLHSKFFGVAEDSLQAIYFSFLGNYKLAIFVFNLVPYCALKIMG